MTMLPAPPGSRIAAVCSAGPPASDLLVFRQALHRGNQNSLLLASIHSRDCCFKLKRVVFSQRRRAQGAAEPATGGCSGGGACAVDALAPLPVRPG